ncbi:MAG: zinc ribbon domain-containing protein [Sarcina sp.]
MFCGKCGNNIGSEKFCGNCGTNTEQMKSTGNQKLAENTQEDYFDIELEGSHNSIQGNLVTMQQKEDNSYNGRDNTQNNFDGKLFLEFLKNLVIRPFEISKTQFNNNLSIIITVVAILAIAIMGIIGQTVEFMKVDAFDYLGIFDIVKMAISNILQVSLFYGAAIGLGYVFISMVFKEKTTIFELLNIFAGILIMHTGIKGVILLAGILNIGLISSIGWGLLYLVVFPGLIINILNISQKKTQVMYSLVGIMIIANYIARKIVVLLS